MDKLPIFSTVDVSVLICTFNDEKYIKESINSILNQSFQNFELIIINDGSNDNSSQIIRTFKDKRIRHFENPENYGLEISKNIGIEKARGKYIAFMDGDDISHPDRIKIQYETMESNPDLIICGTLLSFFGEKTGISTNSAKDNGLRFKLLIGVPFPHASSMINRDCLIKNRIKYKLGYKAAEDYIFLNEVIQVGSCQCIQKPLYNYRWHTKNTSVTQRNVQLKSHKKAQIQVIKQILGIELNNREISIINMILIPNFSEKYSPEETICVFNKIVSEKKVKEIKFNNSLELKIAKNFFHYCLYISKRNPKNLKYILNKEALKGINMKLKFLAFISILLFLMKSKLLK